MATRRDPDSRQEPRTDDGRRRRNLSTEHRAALEDVTQELEEIRSSHRTRLDGFGTELAAIRETLDRQDVQAALDRIIAVEETIQRLPVEGEESILDRLGDAEVALQRLAHDGPGNEGAINFNLRQSAREIFKAEIEKHPIWAQMVDNDPALSADYLEDLQRYMASGRDIITSNEDRRLRAARVNDYGEQVINNPKNLRSAGGVTEQVMNTLSTDFDPGFGMRVPAPIATRIVRKAFEVSPLLADSGRATTTSKIYPFLRDTGWDPKLRERGERQDVIEDDENDELFEEDQIDVHEESITTRLTLVMIEDGIDVISEYEMRTARMLAKKASWKIHNGSGTKMPLGIKNDLTVPRIKTGTADSLPFSAIMHGQLDLDPEYEGGSKYYLSKGAAKAAVLAKDAVGNFLWIPSRTDGTPGLLHGFTWARDAYLDNETKVDDTGVTFATGALPVLFGNVANACLYVERLGLQVQIDDITKKGWRKYWSRRRWGWGVVDAAGLRFIEVGVAA